MEFKRIEPIGRVAIMLGMNLFSVVPFPRDDLKFGVVVGPSLSRFDRKERVASSRNEFQRANGGGKSKAVRLVHFT
jgi:hypothetical protein